MSKLLLKAIAPIVVMAATGALVSSAEAQTDLYYDANGTNSGVGGSGSWSTNGANWTTNPLGTSPLVSGNWNVGANWSNNLANNAIFAGSSGAVTISSSVYPNQIRVETTGYSLANPATNTSRGFRTRNGTILGDGVNLFITTGVATNSTNTNGYVAFEGVISNAAGTTIQPFLTITGATTTSNSFVRVGLDANCNVWVPITVATTGSGFTLIRSESGTRTNFRDITVNPGSRLSLGGGTNLATRVLRVNGNITTDTDLVLNPGVGGAPGDVGTVSLYGTNSIGGNVILSGGQLGIGSANALGANALIVSNGATFGRVASIAVTNPISLQGNVTIVDPINNFTQSFDSGFDLNNGARTVTFANSITFNGALTNGTLVLSNSSSLRTATFNGDLNLASFTNFSAGTTTIGSSATIGSLVISNAGVTILTGDPDTRAIASYEVYRGSLNAESFGTNTPSLTLQGSADAGTTVNSASFTNLASGTLATGPINMDGYSALSMDAYSSIASSGTVKFSGISNRIVLTGPELLPDNTYQLLSAASLDTNSLTGPVALEGTGVNNAIDLVLGGPAVRAGTSLYTFRVNGSTLEVQVDPSTAVDLSWAGGASGDWDTDAANDNWTDISSGNPSAFNTGDNVTVGTSATLTVASNGITAGYLTVNDGAEVTLQGGDLTTISVSVDGSTLNVENQITAGTLAATNSTLSGAGEITVTSGVTLASDSSHTVGTRISGSASLTKSGGGAIVLTGSNSYAGDTIISSGILETSGNERIPDSSLVRPAANTTLLLGGSETVAALDGPSTALVDIQANALTIGFGVSTNTYSFAGVIQGSGTVSKIGSGTQTLAGVSTFSGGMTLKDGALRITTSGTRVTNGDSTVTLTASAFGTGTLSVEGGRIYSSTTTSRTLYSSLDLKSDFALGLSNESVGQSGAVSVSANVTGSATTLLSNVVVTADSGVDWQQPINGASFGFTKSGASTMTIGGAMNVASVTLAQGPLTLSGSNSIAGSVNLVSGQLGYGSKHAFGDATIVASGGTFIGRATSFGATDDERTIGNQIILQGDVTLGLGTYVNNFGGIINLNGGTRAVTINNSSYFYGSVTNGNLVVSNTSATRTLYLNASNSFASITQNGGVISLGNDKALGTGSLTVNATTNASTLTTSGDRINDNAIVLEGGATLTANTAALTNTPFNWTQNGVISGLGSISKSGAGTLVLAAANSHTGTNTLSEGTLVVANASALGASNNALNLNGGILLLAQSSGSATTGSLAIVNSTVLDLGDGAPARTIRFGGLTAATNTTTLTISNTGNGSVYFPTDVSTTTLAQVKSAENPTFTASVDPTTGLLTFSGGATPPSGLSYTPSSQTGTVGTAITSMNPTVTGTVTNYSVSPTLPAGLSINASSGVISGTPTATATTNSYTVTAANEGGTTTANVTIAVQSAYDAWSQGAALNSTNLLTYAIGGASSPTATNGVAPVTTVTSNALAITAIVRTNDPSLAVYGQSITNLSTDVWATNDVTMTVSTNQSGVPADTQRQIFVTPRATNDSRKFLRLNTTLSQ